METVYETRARVFKALCDERRQRILELLQGGEKCACVLIDAMDMPQSSLSYHMKILCDSGIVVDALPHQPGGQRERRRPAAGNHGGHGSRRGAGHLRLKQEGPGGTVRAFRRDIRSKIPDFTWRCGH